MDYLPRDGNAAEESNENPLEELRRRLERALAHNAEMEKAMAQGDEDAQSASARLAELALRNKNLEAQNAQLQVCCFGFLSLFLIESIYLSTFSLCIFFFFYFFFSNESFFFLFLFFKKKTNKKTNPITTPGLA